jgi:hypothetical protein
MLCFHGRKLYNRAKRMGEWDTYKEAFTCYNKEIKNAKRSSWTRYCQGNEDVPGSTGFMKIIVQQVTHKVGSMELSYGHYAQTASEALKELCRVHFLDCRPVDWLTDGQGQSNLGACSCKTNRQDWKLARRVTELSKIKWAINMFRPFKSAATDDTVPAILKNGVEQIASYLC